MKNEVEILFFKYPQHGRVKTRLAKSIGDTYAYTVYRCFLEDMFNAAEKVRADKLIAYSAKPGTGVDTAFFREYTAFPQEGNDLGERIFHAFFTAFARGYSSAVLIGSDCPDLPAESVNKSFHLLEHHDCVIGPGRDGGYYLIALNHVALAESLFRGIPWSSAEVFDKTVSAVRSLGLSYSLLEEREDIDDLKSLQRFFKGCRYSGLPLQTLQFLEKHQEVVYGQLRL